ncbi:P-loop containing nucleoside triphosphate hydrolase protein [Xylariomycetidae sp. FL2044]|nr:P-loop containing nucleoside triphosphate hydrolase protein [Xylariomycetidae sp. FL2044]
MRGHHCSKCNQKPARFYMADLVPDVHNMPFAEQKAVVELSRTRNVVVSARPGSGKTATAKAIVDANPGKRVVVITYSKRLQLETARRLDGCPGCHVYTFHGMAGKLFGTVVQNDTVLRSLRHDGIVPVWRDEPYDLVILDELQDCTKELFWLTSVFILSLTHATAGGKPPRVVSLGDERQAIYGFRGADARYLGLCPDTLGPISPYAWSHMPLSRSFRLSHETSRFLNQVFLGGEEYATGSHTGPRPIYVNAALDQAQILACHLAPLIRRHGANRTAILAPFVRANETLARLTNLLSEKYGFGIAVSISDEAPLDDLVIGGKICVTTYHQFKGSERDLVIVYGVDAAYFQFLGRDLPEDQLPNATFVALTRAKKQLVVLQDAKQRPMSFMRVPQLMETARYVNLARTAMQKPLPTGRPLLHNLMLPARVFVSDMARHVPEEILEGIVRTHLIIDKVVPPLPHREHIEAPEKTLTNSLHNHYEAVSDLNGIAIVAAYELALRGMLASLGYPRKPVPKDVSVEDMAAWLCQQACAYEASRSGYRSRYLQMRGHAFDWLGPSLAAATQRLKAELSAAGKYHRLDFEVSFADDEFEVAGHPSGLAKEAQVQKTRLSGRADIVDWKDYDPKQGVTTATIWEIKFVAELSLQHVVQAAAYAYLFLTGHEERSTLPPRIVLFNIRDGQRWEIRARNGVEGLRLLLEQVLREKYTTRGGESTEEFLRTCHRTREEAERLWQ